MLRSSSLQPTLRACNVGYKRKKLHGKIINKALTRTTNLDINHTYLAKIALKTKDPLYLYQDGTVGYLGDKGSRTPIGVVVKEKTSDTDKGFCLWILASYRHTTVCKEQHFKLYRYGLHTQRC